MKESVSGLLSTTLKPEPYFKSLISHNYLYIRIYIYIRQFDTHNIIGIVTMDKIVLIHTIATACS